MRLLRSLASIFLLLVGVEYVLVGIMVLLGLHMSALMLAGYGLVAPLQLIESSFKFINLSLATNLLVLLLGSLGILGGVLAIVGANDMLRGKKRGYKFWLFLVSLSWAVALLNTVAVRWDFRIRFISIGWALSYTVALWLVWRESHQEAV